MNDDIESQSDCCPKHDGPTLSERAIRSLAVRNADVHVADIERRGMGSFTIDNGVEIEVGEFVPPSCCEGGDCCNVEFIWPNAVVVNHEHDMPPLEQ